MDTRTKGNNICFVNSARIIRYEPLAKMCFLHGFYRWMLYLIYFRGASKAAHNEKAYILERMVKTMKKLLAFALVLGMLVSLVTVSSLAADEVAKPDKITIMVDATLVTTNNGRDAFEARWEELTGIDLEFIQPDHDAYYDVMQQQIASGDWPDVILMSSHLLFPPMPPRACCGI